MATDGKLHYDRRDDNLMFEASFDEDEQVALAIGLVLGLTDVGQARFLKDLHAVMHNEVKPSPLTAAIANLLRQGKHERIEIVVPNKKGILYN